MVLLPEPVGPVTRNRPRGRSTSLMHTSGRPKLLGREHVVGNLPQHHRDVAALLEDRHAEAGQVAEGKAKVGTALLLQLALAALGRDALHQGDRVFGLEHLGFELAHPAVQAKHGGLADDDVNIARPLLHAGLQQLVDENGHARTSSEMSNALPSAHGARSPPMQRLMIGVS